MPSIPIHRSRAALALGALLLSGAAAEGSPMDRLRYQEYPHLEGRPVAEIVILGNDVTQERVFRREMRLMEGEPFSSENLWRDWERIVDLGLFAHVEVDAVPADGGGVLVVLSVFERPRWFATPVVDYGIDDGDITYGFRTRFRNLGGLNRQLRVSGRAGERNRLSASWSSPWLGERRQAVDLGLRIELPQKGTAELRTSSFAVSTTSFVGDYKQTRLGITGFGRLDLLKRDGTHPLGPVNQLSPVIGAGLFRDKRNVRIDPTRGTLSVAQTELVSGWTATDELSYLRSRLDFRIFRSVGWGVVLAGRSATVLSLGKVPEYRRLTVGGNRSIRGQDDGVVVGSNTGRASAEIRFPILGSRRFSLPLPLVPKRISNFDLRIDGELFADVGSAWDDSPGFRKARFRPGYGIGLRIFLPVIELARLELAFDEEGHPTITFTDGNLI